MDLNRRTLIPIVVAVGGGAVLIYGVGLIYLPAALILAGVLLLAAGLLPDWGV